jgi:alkyl hydroperoxide reductase subunit AhpC
MTNFTRTKKYYAATIFFYWLDLFFSFLLIAQEKPEGLFINSKAPDFKATDQYGNEIRLKDVLKDSLVVLIFYRGQWCPYCNKQLKKLEDSLQLIKDKGQKLIAVTPEKTEYISKTIKKQKQVILYYMIRK